MILERSGFLRGLIDHAAIHPIKFWMCIKQSIIKKNSLIIRLLLFNTAVTTVLKTDFLFFFCVKEDNIYWFRQEISF